MKFTILLGFIIVAIAINPEAMQMRAFSLVLLLLAVALLDFVGFMINN